MAWLPNRILIHIYYQYFKLLQAQILISNFYNSPLWIFVLKLFVGFGKFISSQVQICDRSTDIIWFNQERYFTVNFYELSEM